MLFLVYLDLFGIGSRRFSTLLGAPGRLGRHPSEGESNPGELGGEAPAPGAQMAPMMI